MRSTFALANVSVHWLEKLKPEDERFIYLKKLAENQASVVIVSTKLSLNKGIYFYEYEFKTPDGQIFAHFPEEFFITFNRR